nr:trehalose-phosphatase [Chloroflexota bacterium]
PLLIVSDFDGTLAVGSRDPAVARIEPLAQRALRHLARLQADRPGRLHLAVLTGRTVPDVVARVRVGGIEYLGDHGLQSARLERRARAGSLEVRTDPAFGGQHRAAEVLAAGVARRLAGVPWLFVERKGASVAFHVRQAEDVPAARARVIEAVAAVESEAGLGDHGLEPYRGRSVVDLRPREAGGKREAVAGLLARTGAGAVIVLGDELSDVDAFEAVHAARDAGAPRPVVGITVAVHGVRPAPAELLARADLSLGSARAVGRLLADLARRIERA